MNLIKQSLCLIAALALLLSAGCDNTDGGHRATSEDSSALQDTAQQTADTDVNTNENENKNTNKNAERLYTIPLGVGWGTGENWVVDGNGNEVTPQEEDSPDYTETVLTDIATDETRYRYRTRDEVIRDGQGNPQNRRLCSIYDLDGNQLIPWEEKSYRDAFGEYIIRQDAPRGMAWEGGTIESSLYHVPTGAESHEGAHRAAKLNGDAFLLIGDMGATIGVINSAGEALTDFPLSKPYYNVSVWNGFVTANSENPNEQTKENRGVEYLLEFKDGNLRELLAAEWMSGIYGDLKGKYLAYRNGDAWGIYQSERGIVFTSDGASIEYYDGELAIVETGSYRGDEPINASLVTQENKELAGGFSWLKPIQSYVYEDKTPAAKFLGLKDGKAVLIDRDGNVIASSLELPELVTANVKSVNTLCDGLYTYYAETDTSYGHGLLGPSLEVLIPMGRYSTIDLAPGFYSENGEWDRTAETVLLSANVEIGDSNEPGHMIYRMDILDHTGKVIADNVTDIYDAGSGRIALRRGFDAGLMDYDGNWIVKRRIFTGFGDD